MKAFRARARKEMEKGPVTQAYAANLEHVLSVLNDSLATEIVCVRRYNAHHYGAKGPNAEPIAAEFPEHARPPRHRDRGRDRAADGQGPPAGGIGGHHRLHALVAEHAPAAWAELPAEQVAGQVVVGIETDRGPWVTALRGAGYRVFAINPLSAASYRERRYTSGAKSDAVDAHVLAEIVRLDRDHHRQIAGDADLVDAVKLLARAHHTAVWERNRQVLGLRSMLCEYFPAAVGDELALGGQILFF